MKILAFDTTSKICSVALLEDEKVIDEINLDSGLTHSEKLMPLIKEILEKNNYELKDMDLMCIDQGPGSFTGIRIGIATVKALSEVTGIKIAGCTSLEVLARSINVEENDKIAVCIDARNNQVYYGLFDSKYNKISEYMADDINVVLEDATKYADCKINFIGDGSVLHKELIESKISNSNVLEIKDQFAKYLGMMGYKKFNENKLENADSILPIYLRNRM